jgi:enoyl-CoA hydratase/carnithine racemase
MKFQSILVEERDGGLGIITLNRPDKRNAISIEMRVEISTLLNKWADSSHARVVIITGAGSSFSAGFDLDEFDQRERFDELFESSTRYHRDLWNFPWPIVAAVNGPAMGGGFDLATFADIRICSEKAAFGHPEIKFGAPPLFTPLRWIVGDGVARDLCLRGRRIGASEAYRIGLTSEVVEGEGLIGRAIEIGKEIVEAPGDTLLFTKGYLTGNVGRGFEESFSIEHDRAFREIILKRAEEGIKRKNR